MTTLSPGLDAALSADAVLAFGAVEIVVSPSLTLRLLDGAGSVTFDGMTFVGEDAAYGTLGAVDAFTDGFDNQAPTTTIVVMPPTNSAVAALAAPTAQGGQVSIWVGALNPVTGSVIGDPDLRFVGALDVPTLAIGRNTRSVSYTVVSAFERFFQDNEGVRLSDAFHQAVYPGETGLSGITDVNDPQVWGADPPPAAVVAPVVAGGGVSVSGLGQGLPFQPF